METYRDLLGKFSFTAETPSGDTSRRILEWCIHCGQFLNLENNFVLKGERRTGTGVVSLYLHYNTMLTYNQPFWKHDILPREISHYYNHKIKIITISRNIFSWLHSLYRNPWHILEAKDKTFEEFVTSPCISIADMPVLSAIFKVGIRQPFQTHPNPIQLYNEKYQRFMIHSEYHIVYENFMEDPYNTTVDLCRKLDVPVVDKSLETTVTNNAFTEARKEFLADAKYLEEYDKELVNFILSELDKRTYEKLGYDY